MNPRLKLEQNSKTMLMQHIEKISEKLEGSNLSESRLTEVYSSIEALSASLGVSHVQAILFTSVLTLNFKNHPVSLDHISGFLAVPGIKLIQYLPDLTELQQKRWIRADNDRNSHRSTLNAVGYYVSREVFDRLNTGEYREVSKVKPDIDTVLADVIKLTDDFSADNLCHSEMMHDVREITEANSNLNFIKVLKEQRLSETEELLFMIVCHRTLLGDAEVDLEKLVQVACGSSYYGINLKRSIIREQNRLIKLQLLKMQEGMFRNNHEVLLTDKAVELFFPEDADILIKKSANSSNMVKAETIKEIQLFFNETEQNYLERLEKLISNAGYNEVSGRMKKQGIPAGFCILFHGTPGTGKTEAVNQLARITGRDLMRVDISKAKSMWFGESEKKIAEIFAQYRQLLKYSKTAPILLFNEADGIFGIRSSTLGSPVSQTLNTMQNILLQEMENFEGILLATTNLTGNFDKAFERRFLYKVEFTKPDARTREKIWISKVPGINSAMAKALANQFEFSGGQIENISRKFMVDSLLSDISLSLETFFAYCKEEQLYKPVQNSLGFQQGNFKNVS